MLEKVPAMIHVIATIDIESGQRDAFLNEFRQIVPKVQAEDGCIEYGPAIDADTDIQTQTRIGDDVVMVIEKWESVAALKAHSSAPHMLAYRTKVKDIVRSTTVRVLEPA